jgi:hypothetical protein
VGSTPIENDFDKRVTDSQIGFRAIERSVLDRLNLESVGYEIETEITVKSLKTGFTFKETQINCERKNHAPVSA